MGDGKHLLLDILAKNGGKRAFPKRGNERLLHLLDQLVREGKIEAVTETEEQVIYRLCEPVLAALDAR